MKKINVKHVLLLSVLLMMAYISQGQPPTQYINVKGWVQDENHQPVAASVTVKGTRIGTATNEKGAFAIDQVDAQAVLIISAIGISTIEVRINGRTDVGVLRVSRIATTDEEVIVKANTGYQTLKPNEINGAVAVLDNKQLNLQTGTNILKRLDGAASGLVFNLGKRNQNSQNKTGISVRGLGTIHGPLDPLVVLDGFIYEGNIDNINPNDIENISILKDAAAASIWGARAGNGVIVITSKKGALNQKLSVGVTTGILIAEKPNLGNIPGINAVDYIELEELLFNKGFYDARINGTPHLAITPVVKILLNRRNGLISAGDSMQQIDALKAVDTRSQYDKLVYRTGLTQQHSINLRSGTAGSAFTFSAGYDKSTGNLREQYNKLNLRLGNVQQLHKLVKLNIETYYTNSESLSGQKRYGELRPADNNLLYYNLQNADGTAAGIDYKYNTARTDTLLGGRLLDHQYYILENYKHNRITTNLHELNANVGLQVQAASFLQFDLRYQYQVQQAVAEQVADIQSYEARELINSLTSLDPANGRLIYTVPRAGFKRMDFANIYSQTLRGQVNFNKSFGSHSINAIAGTEIREVKNNGNSYTVYGYNADPLTQAAVDYVGTYIDGISGFPTGIPGAPFSTRQVYRFTALYFNASWLLKEKYSMSASGRRDGSNIFGANTNDRFKPLWSVGAGWHIVKESFFKCRLFNDLRLRVSYGHSGNVDLSKTAVPTASTGNDATSNLPFARVRQINNPYLKWEQVRQINIGADFSMFDKRISGSLDWYSKAGRDLYGPVAWDYTATGTPTVTQNIADTKGRGIDLNISSRNIAGAFSWSTNFLLSYNKTITKRYYSPNAADIFQQVEGGSSIIPVVGRDMYGIAAYRWGGLDAAGNPQGYVNGLLSTNYSGIRDYSLTGENLVYFGSGTPLLFGSIGNHFSYKKLTLSVNVVAKFNYYFMKPAINHAALMTGNPGTDDYKNRWKQPGDEKHTNIPSFVYPYNPDRDFFYAGSSINVLKGDHIRLQYINLAYTPVFKKLKAIKDLQFYVNAANLGVLWKANAAALDPDYPMGGEPSKIWSVGLRANF